MTTVGWHPVALSVSVEPGSSAGARIDGREFVVWRDNNGQAHVWEDRCPHRGMKLSFGFVRGDHIACLYHGWQYDTAGQCRYIPAHPDLKVPRAIAVPVYRTIEAAGMIWTTTDTAEASLPDDQGEVVPVRSLYMEGDVQSVLAAVEAMPPLPYSRDEAAARSLQQAGGNLYRLAAGADTLLLGLQRLAGDRTALHVVIAGPAATYAGKGQAHFLAWTAELRHRLEKRSASAVARITEAA
jgi:nitrite reductase/ring-hydroxylating ferredoxin subunit